MYQPGQPLYYPLGFSDGTTTPESSVSRNGSAFIDNSIYVALYLTDNGSKEAGSAFYLTPVNIDAFTTDFTFLFSHLTTEPFADGITFTIQDVGPNALGGDGGSLGYAGIGKSVAIKFDTYQNEGDPSNNSTGVFVDGALPIGVGSINLNGTGINLPDESYYDFATGDQVAVHVTYYGGTLALRMTDLSTNKSWTDSFAIDIPAIVGGKTAYVGFTGGTGNQTATQGILNWTFE